MREEGRVPYNVEMQRQLRERRKRAPVNIQEAPGNDEYRRDLRRRKQIYQMLRDRSYRERH